MDKSSPLLIPGIDSFTLDELKDKAANYKGLTMCEGGSSQIYTQNIAKIPLTETLISFLGTRGIKREEHSEGIFTLIDTNPQKHVPGYNPSNSWNFRLDGRRQPQIRLYFQLNLHSGDRGFRIRPKASGNYGSAVDALPNFRMFEAVVESGVENLPSVAYEMAAASDGYVVVTWTDLGLGGIRNVYELFEEFSGNNAELHKIAQRGELFNPAPTRELFVVLPAQPKVITTWRNQLEEYRNSLVVWAPV